MNTDNRHADNLRAMFGANLRKLASTYPSVSSLCRDLGINRTQFNRYLSGESFPRPDVLDRICRFFDVDARILLKQLEDITPANWHPAAGTLADFLGSGSNRMQHTAFAPGFYAIRTGEVQTSLLYATRLPQCTLIRGYVSQALMPDAPAKEREIRGIAASASGQIYILTSHRNGENSWIHLVEQSAADASDEWTGTAIGLFEANPEAKNAHQIVMNFLDHDRGAILDAARRGRLRGNLS